MAAVALASELYEQAQNFWSYLISPSSSSALAGETPTDSNEWPEISEACARCSAMLTGPQIATVLQKRTDMHLVEAEDELINDPRDTLQSLFAHRVTFRRSRRALMSGREQGCDMCGILLDLDRRCNTPGRRRSDPSIGVTSLGEVQRTSPNASELSFVVARSEHFASILNVAVSDHMMKFLMLEVSAPEGSSAATLFPGQLVHLGVGSARSFIKAREWIQECNLNHANCPKLDQRQLPARVLEILPDSTAQDVRVRLHRSDGRLGKYAALSYCWGGPQPITTTWATESGHLEGISFQQLPRTIQDALVCTLELGLRYLWVDSLCVIQDPSPEKDGEIAEMANIYRNAYITIQATSAGSCRDGFLQTRKQRTHAIRLPCEYAPGRVADIVVSPAIDVVMPRQGLREPLHDRAWILQEGLLSPRVLMYSKAQLYLKCASGFHKDGGQSTWKTYAMGMGTTPVAAEHLSLLGHGSSNNVQPNDRQIRGYWERLIVDFTARSLSDPSDKLIAVSGLAKSFADHTGDAYLAGCWRRDILYEIGWVPGHQARVPERHHRVLGGLTRCTTWRAPSWSWASVDGPVWFPSERHLIPGEGAFELDGDLKFLACDYRPAEETAPYGRGALNSGKLVLEGHLKSLEDTSFYDLRIETTGGLVSASFRDRMPPSELRARPYAGVPLLLGTIALDTPDGMSGSWMRAYDRPSWWCLLLGSFTTEHEAEEIRSPVPVEPTYDYMVPGAKIPVMIAFGLVLVRDPSTRHFQRVGTFRGNVSNAPFPISRKDVLEWFKDCEVQPVVIL